MAGGSKGSYSGGGTLVSGKTPEWFSKDSTYLSPDERISMIPARSKSEQEAFEQFKKELSAPKVTLIKAAELNSKNRKK